MFSMAITSTGLRLLVGAVIAALLALHGIKKKSLDRSGATAAVLVGLTTFAVSYRKGIILILFYYVSSKLTKIGAAKKATLESDYQIGGERNYKQVLASSLIGTLIAILYYYYCGEDSHVSFSFSSFSFPSGSPDSSGSQGTETETEMEMVKIFGSYEVNKSLVAAYLWSMYIAHYASVTADTWASEVGILAKGKPRLITSFFLREVPSGTNGGVSLEGTAASAAGGLFIGLIFWIVPILCWPSNDQWKSPLNSQYPMLILSTICGILGSMIDSLLGATLQATYYSTERKCIVKKKEVTDPTIIVISGQDLLTNEDVNWISILFTTLLSIWLAPIIFLYF